jgi:N-succinyldiaminopimelate aminotransferase
MPKFPGFSFRVQQIPGPVFERYAKKMKEHGDNLIKLHIGDSPMHPYYKLPIDAEFIARHSDFNQYCSTFGIEPLREALAAKLQEDNGINATMANVLVSCGATSGLSASVLGLVDPGEEVLILTPAWPFFFGMVKNGGGTVIEAPFYDRLFTEPDFDVYHYLGRFVTPKTVAIYLNTPNNPSAKVMSPVQVKQVARLAAEHNLWVISDEAYDGLIFDELEHLSIASLPGMAERTVTVFTFSKAFLVPGLRVGYVAANREAIVNINKMLVHELYGASTFAQQVVLDAVRNRREWLGEMVANFQELRDVFLENLTIPVLKPESTYFAFFCAENHLKGRDYWQVIEECLDAGVCVSPGDSFGKDYHSYIRLCFTGETTERLLIGIERLNRIFS